MMLKYVITCCLMHFKSVLLLKKSIKSVNIVAFVINRPKSNKNETKDKMKKSRSVVLVTSTENVSTMVNTARRTTTRCKMRILLV